MLTVIFFMTDYRLQLLNMWMEFILLVNW